MNLHEKWNSIEVVTDNKAVGFLFDILKQDQSAFKMGTVANRAAGQVSMVRHADYPDRVLEVVYGTTSDDLLQTVYKENPAFVQPSNLLQTRSELISMIEDLMEADPGRLIIECPARHRPVELRELGTGMLVDILRLMLKNR